MDIIGYSDPLTARPGDTVRVMVSCQAAEYRAELVRLIHGDLDERGPGLRTETCDVTFPDAGIYRGRVQDLRTGSRVQVDAPGLAALQAFSLEVRVFATSPGGARQCILGCWDPDSEAGYGLFLDEAGAAELRLGDGKGRTAQVTTGVTLRSRAWYVLTATFDPGTSEGRLRQQPVRRFPSDPSAAAAAHRIDVTPRAPVGTPFVIAGAGGEIGRLMFNGKLEDPVVRDESGDTVAAWNLGAGPGSTTVIDEGPNGLTGMVVNAPLRGVTGSNWNGRNTHFDAAPNQYRAIHFHDDDLDDARWDADFELQLPSTLRSGFYAIHLETEQSDDWVPILIAPACGEAPADVALLAPTLSYLAYANEHMVEDPERRARNGVDHSEYLERATPYERSMFEYIVANRLHSTYDRHTDGSGVHYSSSRRPLANVRPTYNKPSIHFQIPHQLGADLYLVDWLETKGFEYDVLNDHLLHAEGVDALAPYRVILTGTHPEYYTERMLIAVEQYLERGGRLMYLGGNGFYWVTSVDRERPHMIEVRRGEAGTRTWQGSPGENHHNTTGELGGIWRARGRPPQRLVGIGFTSQGSDNGRPYRRTQASHEPRFSFVFEGVEEELIGDAGLYLEAAAGWELDRYDEELGSPPGTVVLATAAGFSDSYQHAIEEVLDGTNPREGGTLSEQVRADMTLCDYPEGGAVFSVGSITWAGSLSLDGYDNPISRVTENVLRAFMSPDSAAVGIGVQSVD